jgi:hypothetical protein
MMWCQSSCHPFAVIHREQNHHGGSQPPLGMDAALEATDMDGSQARSVSQLPLGQTVVPAQSAEAGGEGLGWLNFHCVCSDQIVVGICVNACLTVNDSSNLIAESTDIGEFK